MTESMHGKGCPTQLMLSASMNSSLSVVIARRIIFKPAVAGIVIGAGALVVPTVCAANFSGFTLGSLTDLARLPVPASRCKEKSGQIGVGVTCGVAVAMGVGATVAVAVGVAVGVPVEVEVAVGV